MRTTGLLDFFKRSPIPAARTDGKFYAPTNGGGVPFYSSFGESVYASDIIVQSIRCKANEFKKLDPRHIRTTNGQQTVITDSSIARVLKRPNPYMTTADFLEKITILLELNKNVFIYPEYYITNGGERYYTGIYPLKPSGIWYLVDAKGKYHIKMQFASGYEVTLPSDSVIHWRKDFYDDYFGGNSSFDDNKGLLKMLKRYDQLTQSIAKALECSCQINGMVRYNSYLNDEKTEKARTDFEARLKNNQSGILFADLKTEYTHFPRDVKLVDAETLKFFYDTILRANGCSLAILNHDYTKAQKEAYYESALQPDIISLGQAMSRVLFTDREAAFGNEITLYPNAIEFMTMSEKIAYMQVAVPAGALSINRILAFGGFPPVEGGDARPRGFNSLDGATGDNGVTNTDVGSVDAQQQQEIIDDAKEVVKKPLLVGQIQSLTQIVSDYQEGKYTYNQTLNMLMIAVGLSKEDAEKILAKQDVE